MEIEELSKKIDKYNEDNKKQNTEKQLINIALVAAGFSLAIFNTWLSSNGSKTVNLIFAIVLLVIGIVSWCFSFKYKVK